MKILIFGGTYEGRILCEKFISAGLDISVSVATEEGRVALSHIKGLNVSVARLGILEMQSYISSNNFQIIIDATHPYAREVSKNIREVCSLLGLRYIRLLRDSGDVSSDILVSDMYEAVDYLSKVDGNVLVTTGSKELSILSNLDSYDTRLFVRLLPVASVLDSCVKLGYKTSNIIALQGPFTHEMNVAMLNQYKCKYLLTKNGGSSGGIDEKLSAAKECSAKLIMIDRPYEPEGLSLNDVLSIFLQDDTINPNHSDKSTYFKKAQHFPIFVSCKSKSVIVIGGGEVALRRVNALLKFDLDIVVISPIINRDLEELLNAGKINCIRDRYNVDYIDRYSNIIFVLACTNSRDVNYSIGLDCKKRSIHVSVADRSDEGTFYFPGSLVKDDLIAAVISDSKKHHDVKRVIKELNDIL